MHVQAEILRRAIAAVRTVCDARAYLPQLAYGLLVSSTRHTATLTATDLDVWVDVVFPIEGPIEPCLLDLAALSKRVPAKGRVEITADSGEYWLVDGRRRLRIPSVPVDAWPEHRPDAEHVRIAVEYPADAFLAALEHARPAISDDVSRPMLRAVLLDSAGRVVATDGHRCHWTEGFASTPDWRLPGSLVGALLDAVRRAGTPGEHVIVAGHGAPTSADHRQGLRVRVQCRDLDVSVCSREHVEPFPPWDRAVENVSAGEQERTTLDGSKLLEELRALGRAGFADGPSTEVRLSVEGAELRVDLFLHGALEARTTITVEDRSEMTISALKPVYVREALAQALGRVVVTRGRGPNQPLLFALGEGRHALVMHCAM